MKLMLGLGCLFGLIVALSGQHRVISEEIPYLYYYSATHRGIVVERADGRDSRVLGRGVVEAEKEITFAAGPGWSSDRTWFAWRIETNHLGFSQNDRAYAVHIDGERTVGILDDFTCVHNLFWHPTHNILLVHGSLRWDKICGNSGSPVGTFRLIDADANQLLGTVSINQNPDYLPGIYWLEDRDMVQFSAGVDVDAGEQYQRLHYLVTMQFDGTVTMQPSTREEIEQAFVGLTPDRPTQLEQTRFTFGYPEIGVEHIPTSIDNPHVIASQWDPTGTWLLIAYDWCIAGCANVIGEVSLYHPAAGLHREISDCGGHDACLGWLGDDPY